MVSAFFFSCWASYRGERAKARTSDATSEKRGVNVEVELVFSRFTAQDDSRVRRHGDILGARRVTNAVGQGPRESDQLEPGSEE